MYVLEWLICQMQRGRKAAGCINIKFSNYKWMAVSSNLFLSRTTHKSNSLQKQFCIEAIWLCDFCVGINQTARRIHFGMARNKKTSTNAFFYGISPLILMFKFAGGLLICENYDKDTKKYRLKFKFLSPWTISSVLINGLQIYMIVWLSTKAYQVWRIHKCTMCVLIFCQKNFSMLELSESFTALSFLFNLFAPMTSPVFIGIQSKRSLKYVESWFEFQVIVKIFDSNWVLWFCLFLSIPSKR